MAHRTNAATPNTSSERAGHSPIFPEHTPALGSDPFECEPDEPDPFLEGLALLRTGLATRAQARPQFRSPALSGLTDVDRTRAKEREWIEVPELCDVDLPERRSWVDRLLSDEERRRIASIANLSGGEAQFDRFGLSPDAVRNSLPIMTVLYALYFRVWSHGHVNIPKRGPVVIAGNHAGVLPFDAAMVATDLFHECDPPRLARTIVDRWAGTLPWVNVFFARCGQVVGTPENFADLLASGQAVVAFPEGMKGAIKPYSERYRLQEFRVGFIEQALAAGAPIVPTAVLGSDEQTPVLFDLAPLARLLGLPSLPITPTFPWLGPLGLLPYPVSYEIVYGEPLRFYERYSAEDGRDPDLIRSLADEVQAAVQRMIDQRR